MQSPLAQAKSLWLQVTGSEVDETRNKKILRQRSRQTYTPGIRHATWSVFPIRFALHLGLVGWSTPAFSSACWQKTVVLCSHYFHRKILSGCQAVCALHAFTGLPMCATQLNPGSSYQLFLLKWRWLVPQWLESAGVGGGRDSYWSFFPHSDLPEFRLKNPIAPAAFANIKLLVNRKTHANALAEPWRRLIESRLAVK